MLLSAVNLHFKSCLTEQGVNIVTSDSNFLKAQHQFYKSVAIEGIMEKGPKWLLI